MRRTRRALACVVVTAAVLLAPRPVPATTMIPQSLEALTARSVAVVRATTVEARPEWDAHRRIVTVARLRVTESLAGDVAVGRTIEVRTFGGTLDGVTLRVIGAPAFAPGVDVVVFLDDSDPAGFAVTDLAQGKFEVRRDARGREVLTRDDLEGVAFTLGAPGERAELAELRTRVRAARLAGRGGAR